MYGISESELVKLSAERKRSIYEMLVSSHKAELITSEEVCLLGLGHPCYVNWLKNDFRNIKHITVIEGRSIKFLYYDLENEYNLIYVDNEDYIRKLKELDMSFDFIITNPPYSVNRKSVHVKILKELLNHRKKGGVCVCIAPSPYTNYKKESCFDMIPSSYKIIDAVSARKVFGDIQLPDSLLITTWKDGVYLDKDEIIKTFVPREYKIICDKVKTPKTFYDVNKSDYENEDFFVPLKLMTSNWDKNKNIIIDKLGLITNGFVDGHIPYKDKRNKNKDRPCGGIPFHDKNSAMNFINSCMTTFFKFLVKMKHTNSRYILKEYPWMEDYSQPWTNERFYEFFGITKEEQNMIEENMKGD